MAATEEGTRVRYVAAEGRRGVRRTLAASRKQRQASTCRCAREGTDEGESKVGWQRERGHELTTARGPDDVQDVVVAVSAVATGATAPKGSVVGANSERRGDHQRSAARAPSALSIVTCAASPWHRQGLRRTQNDRLRPRVMV